MRTLGIDLGTTNTVGALDGTVVMHMTGTESVASLPSVVAFPPSGAMLVGTNAKRRRAIDPSNVIFSSKRIIGRTWSSAEVKRFRTQYPFELVAGDDDVVLFRTRAGDFTPTQIATRIVEKLLSANRGDPKQRVVVTVPAAFKQAQRDATIEAVHAAGPAHVTVLDEPVATALAYGTALNERHPRVAVYDFGGGTFDLALVDTTVNPARVLSHAGDDYLGGDDIDQALACHVAEHLLREHGWDVRAAPEVYDRLVVQCERAKMRLCLAGSTRIELGQVDPASPLAMHSVVIDRTQLDALCGPIVQRTFLLCDQVLRDAKLTANEVDAVCLAGGTTLLPIVRDGVARYFSSLPRCDFDPMEVVAIGASLSE